MMRVIPLLLLVAIINATTVSVHETTDSIDGRVIKNRFVYLNGQKVREIDDVLIKRLLIEEVKTSRLVSFGKREFTPKICDRITNNMMSVLVGAACFSTLMTEASIRNKTNAIIDQKAAPWNNLLPGAPEDNGNKVRCYQDGLLLAMTEKMGRK